MTTLEKIELSCIGLIVMAVYFASWLLPEEILLGSGVIWLAIIVFLQSLLRDLSVLFYFSKQVGPSSLKPIEKQCFCLESLIGVSVLLIGFLPSHNKCLRVI